jgi:sulfur-oxidizing protein SoxY
VREIRIRRDDVPVLTVESDISMSEDPSITFDLPPGSIMGELEAAVDDSSNRHFERHWPLRLDSGS